MDLMTDLSFGFEQNFSPMSGWILMKGDDTHSPQNRLPNFSSSGQKSPRSAVLQLKCSSVNVSMLAPN